MESEMQHCPSQAVPEKDNKWLAHGITELFARFSLNSHHHREKPTATDAAAADGDEEAETEDLAEDRLMDFVRSHATAGAGGYGGWKAAYRRSVSM
jgi:hypothetical protein